MCVGWLIGWMVGRSVGQSVGHDLNLKKSREVTQGTCRGVVFGSATAPTRSAPGVAPTLSAPPRAVLGGALLFI